MADSYSEKANNLITKMNINHIVVAGRLGKDPEKKSLPSGSTVANFSIATSNFWKDKDSGEKKESTEWVSCVCFGKTAEMIGKYFKKGKEIYVEGRMQTRSWEKDGAKHYKTEVLVDSFQFVGYDKDSAKPTDEPEEVAGEETVTYDDEETAERKKKAKNLPF